jgi:hypothetical protein
VATGDLDMQWNFGSRSGAAQVTNFDSANGSHNYYFDLDTPYGSANFVGDLDYGQYEDSIDRIGYMAGAFVNGASGTATGVMGNWGAMERTDSDPYMNPGYVVGGVFMGESYDPGN